MRAFKALHNVSEVFFSEMPGTNYLMIVFFWRVHLHALSPMCVFVCIINRKQIMTWIMEIDEIMR